MSGDRSSQVQKCVTWLLKRSTFPQDLHHPLATLNTPAGTPVSSSLAQLVTGDLDARLITEEEAGQCPRDIRSLMDSDALLAASCANVTRCPVTPPPATAAWCGCSGSCWLCWMTCCSNQCRVWEH
jgi:hypothetical protein